MPSARALRSLSVRASAPRGRPVLAGAASASRRLRVASAASKQTFDGSDKLDGSDTASRPSAGLNGSCYSRPRSGSKAAFNML